MVWCHWALKKTALIYPTNPPRTTKNITDKTTMKYSYRIGFIPGIDRANRNDFEPKTKRKCPCVQSCLLRPNSMGFHIP